MTRVPNVGERVRIYSPEDKGSFTIGICERVTRTQVTVDGVKYRIRGTQDRHGRRHGRPYFLPGHASFSAMDGSGRRIRPAKDDEERERREKIVGWVEDRLYGWRRKSTSQLEKLVVLLDEWREEGST